MHVSGTNLSAFQKSSINLNKNSECYLIISNYTACYDLIADQSRQTASGLSVEAFQAVVLHEAQKFGVEFIDASLDDGEVIVLTIADEIKAREFMEGIGLRFQHSITDKHGLSMMYEHYESLDFSDVENSHPKAEITEPHLDA